MVFGIGEGSMDIVLDKPSYAIGETVRGKAILNLKGPKSANSLRLRFFATRKEQHWVSATAKHPAHYDTRTITLHTQEKVLAPKGSFPSGSSEYAFEVVIPNLGLPQAAPASSGGLVGQIFGSFSRAPQVYPIEWTINVSLDVPMSVDVHKEIAVIIV